MVGVTLYYTHLPTRFERFRCELNRKKSKFERYGLFWQLSFHPMLSREPRRETEACAADHCDGVTPYWLSLTGAPVFTCTDTNFVRGSSSSFGLRRTVLLVFLRLAVQTSDRAPVQSSQKIPYEEPIEKLAILCVSLWNCH